MSNSDPYLKSILRDEAVLRWDFLETESDPCAVVSERMELIYLNESGRAFTPAEWFAQRCFEMLPVTNEECAWGCPTIAAVQQGEGITYCEESLCSTQTAEMTLGTAVIPLGRVCEDGAKALLLFRQKTERYDDAQFQKELLEDAQKLRTRIATQLGW